MPVRCSARLRGSCLASPGFQGGLLGQLQRFHRGGWAAVGALEVGGKHGPPGFDGGSTGRPPGGQGGVDADDFSYRPFPRVLVRPFGESEAETVAEVAALGRCCRFPMRRRWL